MNDDIHWYPMRVTYGRELKVKRYLDEKGVECFLPMRYKIMERHGDRFRRLVPAVSNLIFVRDCRRHITFMKQNTSEVSSLRYIMSRPPALTTGVSEILVVPDRQMENFMKVARVEDESVLFLNPDEYAGKKGMKVKIIDGVFSGVEGVVKRIRQNKKVVVEIQGVAAVAIAFVPSNYLVPIEE